MANSFELVGSWRVPDNPKILAGTLKFDVTGAYLYLVGSFRDLTEINILYQPRIIHGLTPNGKFITLYNCIETNSSFSHPGYLAATFYAQVVFIGVHFNTADEIQFKTISFHSEHIDDWFDASGFSVPNTQDGTLSLTYNTPESVKVQINQEILLRIETNSHFQQSRLNLKGLPKDVLEFLHASFQIYNTYPTLLGLLDSDL
jgi:hypothetical protein